MPDSPQQLATDRTASITPQQTTLLDAAARAGISRAEQMMERGREGGAEGQPPAGDEMPTTTSPADFESALAEARERDVTSKRASTTDSPPEKQKESEQDQAQQAQPDSKPSLDWKPKKKEAAQQWDSLKATHAKEVETLNTQLKALQTEIESLKTTAKPQQDFEKLQQELEQYREIVKTTAIERDPEFNARFKARTDAAVTAAKIAAGDKSSQLEKLLAMPSSAYRDEQISALLEDLPASSQRRIDAALRTLDQISIERDAEIASAKLTWEQKQQALLSQHEQSTKERQTKFNQAFESTLKKWSDPTEGHPFFVEQQGNDAHNKSVKESVALAKEILSGNMSEEDLAAAALWAATGHRILEGWQTAQQEIATLNATINKLRGVTPGVGQTSSSQEQDPFGSGLDPNLKPGTEAYQHAFARQLAEAQKASRGGR